MPFWRTFYHLVWATAGREPLITTRIEEPLFAYVVGKAAELGVYVYAINGWSDHVHLVVAIPPRHAVAEIVKRLKGASAHYVNHDLSPGHHFAWQRSYGVLSLGERQRSLAEAYVAGQKKHHAERTANAWLEKCDDNTDGPDSPESANRTASAHEASSQYDPWSGANRLPD